MNNELATAIRDIITDRDAKITALESDNAQLTEINAEYETVISGHTAEINELLDALRKSDEALNTVWRNPAMGDKVWAVLSDAAITNTNVLAKYEPAA